MGGRVFAVVCLCACGASTPNVRGRVVDRSSQNSIEGVKVLLKGDFGSWVALTNHWGNYELAVPPGIYEVWFAYRESVVSQRGIMVGRGGAVIHGEINVASVWSRKKMTKVGREQGDPMFWFRVADPPPGRKAPPPRDATEPTPAAR
jgi:hypothetical protein